MKLAWLTDIHLNFVEDEVREKFYQEIIKTKPEGLLISGDIAEAPSISEILIEMSQKINKPIYFVLGNHDYYYGEVLNVRKAITHGNHTACA